MLRNQKVALIVGAIIVISCFVVVMTVIPPLEKMEWHYEGDVTVGDQYTRVNINEVTDCKITISFVDDPNLLYSVDILFYEPMLHGTDFTWLEIHDAPSFDEYDNMIGINWGLNRDGRVVFPEHTLFDVPVRSLNLTLGTSNYYDIRILGTNITTEILYDNNAWLGAGSLTYREKSPTAGATLYILMSPEVNIDACSLDITIQAAETFVFDVQNLASFGGTINLYRDNYWLIANGWEQSGWSTHRIFTREANEEFTASLYSDNTYLSLLTQP